MRSLDNGSCSIVSRQWQSDTTTALPNIGNPIAAIVSQCAYQELRADRDTRILVYRDTTTINESTFIANVFYLIYYYVIIL